MSCYKNTRIRCDKLLVVYYKVINNSEYLHQKKNNNSKYHVYPLSLFETLRSIFGFMKSQKLPDYYLYLLYENAKTTF